ncbi:MAG: TVP38/TMEM64 family protein [Nitrospira sp.]|nr:TVP38/TMEM64 family protein [Nitrospira sp.]
MTGEDKTEHRDEIEKHYPATILLFGAPVWLGLIILITFIALVEILYESEVFHLFVEKNRLIELLQYIGPYSFLSFIIIQSLQVVAAPIPGEVTGFVGGYLYGPVFGIIFSTIGLTLGSVIAFSLSRFLGKPFVEKVVKKETLERFDYILKLRHKGGFLVFLLFLIPGFPKDYLCYILGMGPMRFKEFFVVSTAGRFLGTVLLTLGGAYIRKHQYRELFILVGFAIVTVLVAMAFRDKLERLFKKWSHTSKTPIKNEPDMPTSRHKEE